MENKVVYQIFHIYIYMLFSKDLSVLTGHVNKFLKCYPVNEFRLNKQGPPAPPRALLGLPAAFFSTREPNLTIVGLNLMPSFPQLTMPTCLIDLP